MSDKFSTYMKNQIDQINLHLPRKTLSLKQIERLKVPGVTLRDGNFQEFEDKELEYLRSLFNPLDYHRILLPIIITRRRSYGSNAYTIGGDIGNMYVVLKLLGEDAPPFDVWKHNSKEKVIYRPHLAKIRKKLPTTSVLAFS